MPYNNASSPDKKALNIKNTKFASNISQGLYFSLPLATATFCWFNFNPSALAVSIDTQLSNKTSNSFASAHTDNHEYQHHKEHSGLIPRILSLITSPFRNNLEALPKADGPAKEPQTLFHSDAMGGSFTQNLVPMYLSQADTLASNKFLTPTKINAIDSTSSFVAFEKQLDRELYTVKAGDTIAHIADRYKVSRRELTALNQIDNSNVIFVNQKLEIPANTLDKAKVKAEKITLTKANFPQNAGNQTGISARELQEQRLANLKADINQMRSEIERERKSSSVAFDNDKDTDVISSANPKTEPSIDSISEESISLTLPPLPSSTEYLPEAFDGGYSWPARGVLSSGYGWRWGRLHKGIDIAAPVGTPIFAAAAGEVISAGWNSGGYGNLVKLQHLDGSITLYAHNNRILVRNGQRVNKGEQIAEMGNTGFSTGSHLHFEIHSRNKGVVNPLALLVRN